MVTVEEAEKELKWFLFDASGQTLGRFASEIAKILRGKHKTNYTPHVDTGDGVIVINCEKIEVTGNKEAQKTYYRHTNYPGGLIETDYRSMMKKKPDYILFHAVKGMLPNTKLAEKQIKKLRIFRDENHGMQAQKPIQVNLK
jgi:large subunit ribosomal protein L13